MIKKKKKSNNSWIYESTFVTNMLNEALLLKKLKEEGRLQGKVYCDYNRRCFQLRDRFERKRGKKLNQNLYLNLKN